MGTTLTMAIQRGTDLFLVTTATTRGYACTTATAAGDGRPTLVLNIW